MAETDEEIRQVKIKELIEYLQGSCHSLEVGCETIGLIHEDLSEDELEQIYEEIFCCETCNWWLEVSDASEYDANTCIDCAD